MAKADSDTIIDMEPNSQGVFESKSVKKVKDKSAKKDVRPEALKKTRPAKKAIARAKKSRGRREPVKSTVPNPVRDLQEGIQAGLDLFSDIKTIARMFR
jgi:hypothetical protein